MPGESLTILIPTTNRFTLVACVASLRYSGFSGRILIVSGDKRSDRSKKRMFTEVSQHFDTDVITVTGPSLFSKSFLINHGVELIMTEYVLVSDVDIIWNHTALNIAIKNAKTDRILFCNSVIESSYPRKSIQPVIHLEYASKKLRVKLNRGDEGKHSQRPGYGLQLFSRSTFQKIGGYDENFVGWGGEDVDFLLRAYSVGGCIGTFPAVVHISHEGEPRRFRNRFHRFEVIREKIRHTMKSIDRDDIYHRRPIIEMYE